MNKYMIRRRNSAAGLAVLLILTWTMLTPASVWAVSLTRGAYLQLSSPTNITICWRTDLPADSRVRYGTNMADLVFTNDSLVLETNHFVTLTGLQPDTRYFYAIGTTGTNFPAGGPNTNYFFWTHPWPGTEKPIRVWVIGDAGVASNGGSVAAKPQQTVRDGFIKFNGTNTLHAWLQLGDNAYPSGTDLQYQIATFIMYSNLLSSSVAWPALGNHDANGNQTAFVDTYPFFGIFHLPTNGQAGGVPSGTEHYYSFDIGMVHFICLDSVTASRAADGPMANWLRADLAANKSRWTVAYWHYPPYTKGGYDSDARDILIEMRENFGPIIEAGGVDLVFSGHSHVYERSHLINGHYGLSTTFDTNTMIIQPGSGRETNGVGAYLKPDSLDETPVGNRGTIYIVNGCSGDYDTTGLLNHPAMHTSLRTLGSTVLDFTSNRLDFTFLQTNGTLSANYLIGDHFTIIKESVIATNTPPVAQASTWSRNAVYSLKIPLVDLATNWADADGDPLTLTGVHASTNGMTPTYDGSFIHYSNSSEVADQFTYTISDGQGGITNGVINVIIAPGGGGQTLNILGANADGAGNIRIRFAGVPGYLYGVQGTTNQPPSLVPPVYWQTLGSNFAGTNGLWEFTDTNAGAYPQGRFYRSFKP